MTIGTQSRRYGRAVFILGVTAVLVCKVVGAVAAWAADPGDAKRAMSEIAAAAPATPPVWLAQTIAAARDELVKKYGDDQRARIERGLRQVADLWRDKDGDATAFRDFVRTHFAGADSVLDTMFLRFDYLLEQIDGHMAEIGRELRQHAETELTLGPVHPFDKIFAAFDPSAHIGDDFFGNKIAFVVLLNFPLTTLEERLTAGKDWSRRHWAETRLASRFSKRIPAEANLAVSRAYTEAAQYIDSYNIWMHHLIDGQGKRLFPSKLRLLTHWYLRDEIKANYGDVENGLPKQRMVQQVMDRIVTQTIPEAVINNPRLDWNPYTNAVTFSPPNEIEENPPPPREMMTEPAGFKAMDAPEPNTRYKMLLGTFHAARLVDPYSPTAPTLIARRFDENREIPEMRLKAMLEQVLTSPLAPRVAKLIEQRIGRPLEPFDIWYSGFGHPYTEEQLDAMTKKKYPKAVAFEKDIPNILEAFGFPPERARYVANNIVVEPARGVGHALAAEMRSEKARLRARVEADGMYYKAYNIAVHELGHNVEQTFSLNDIDYVLLSGVPNNAITEALAFVLQGHDLELLGLAKPDAKSHALTTLNNFWVTLELSGVALVDMAVWHWMYDHPDATPEKLRDATIEISKGIWNEYFAPLIAKRDVTLLGIYSHMVRDSMYLPDYPIGRLIAFQIGEKMSGMKTVGPEFERVSKIGSLTPDRWMIEATGAALGPEALLAATARALDELGASR